jgi:tubulin monoglycylase TTLL3/8
LRLNALQVWFYDTCYLRFSAEPFDLSRLSCWGHLCNNSVVKHYEGQIEGGCQALQPD